MSTITAEGFGIEGRVARDLEAMPFRAEFAPG